MTNCIHLGSRIGDRCPRCGTVVAPAPQPAPQPTSKK